MGGIDFFRAVEYGTSQKTFGQSALEVVDSYFYLGGRKAVVLDGLDEKGLERVNMEARKTSKLAVTAKIISYLTLVIPFLMLCAKGALRFKHHFTVISPSASNQPISPLFSASNTLSSSIPRKLKHPQGLVDDAAIAVANGWYAYATEKNYEAAYECFKLTEDRYGDSSAQFGLGWCCRYGVGTPKDVGLAIEWFRKAANQGYPDAQAALGDCYKYGEGVPQDMDEAVKWYTKAANQQFPASQYALGLYYEAGKGVPKDMGKAIEWYIKAADQGFVDALEHLGFIYRMGKVVQKDIDQAIMYYERALAKAPQRRKSFFEEHIRDLKAAKVQDAGDLGDKT